MVWYGMVWYGMVWYGKVRYGMVWYAIDSNPVSRNHTNLSLAWSAVSRTQGVGRTGSKWRTTVRTTQVCRAVAVWVRVPRVSRRERHRDEMREQRKAK